MVPQILALAAAFGAGWVACTFTWGRSAAAKRQEMFDLSNAENQPGAVDEGAEAEVQCEPQSLRSFPIKRSDTALVIIDMQADFLSKSGRIGQYYSAADIDAMSSTTAKVADLLAAARRAGLTIAHSRSHRYGSRVVKHLYDTTNQGRAGAEGGRTDEGYDFVPACQPLPGEIVVDKWTFGAFASTDLEDRLRERGVRRILLAGVLTNVCVFATAVQAVDRYFRVCLVEDACGAFSREWHDKAVALLNQPQTMTGHAKKAVGLYFGEVSSVDRVKAALDQALP